MWQNRATVAPQDSSAVQLFVAEKPSVARDLARILGARHKERGAYSGPGIVVTWCIGHVAELEEPQAYNPAWRAWRKDGLPMLPSRFKLRPNAATLDHWQVLAGWLRHPKITRVVNACDAGREGELIFCYAQELSGCNKPVWRLWLNALTDAAVRHAIKAMRPQRAYQALADAARCRAEADWLVGLNATRALTIARRQQGEASSLLTVGRVQTPTLAMLVQREEAIEAFEPEPYWQVQCCLEAAIDAPEAPPVEAETQPPQARATAFAALYAHTTVEDGKKVTSHKLATLALAERIQQDITNAQGKISAVSHKELLEPPPLLHDLTSLQRLANLRYGLTAQATLEAAQALYERHKAITYPRTDSNYLPQSLKDGLMPLLGRLNRGDMAPLVAPLLTTPPKWAPVGFGRIVKDSEVSDHHAIIPTGTPPPPMGVSEAERQIYDLIVRRFVAAFYPPVRIGLGTLTAKVAGHTFIGRGRMVLEPGWHAVEPPLGRSNDKLLPTYRRSDAVTVSDAKVESLKTRPPPRLNEAALLGAMERAGAAIEQAEVRLALKEQGLGTPATRAAIIENLKRRSYVRLDGRYLRPSPEGRALLAALPVEDLKSAELTGRWEAKLSRVAKGELSRDVFMQETHAFVKTMVATILETAAEPADAAVGAAKRGPHKPLGRAAAKGACPICGEAQVRRGDTLSCARGRACTFVIFSQVAGRTLRPQEVAQLLRGERTDTLKGFVSRAGKPFAAKLELDERGRVAFVFAPAVSVP